LLTEIIGTRKLIAFLSYVHSDDEHDNGGLTQFCKRLSAEVKSADWRGVSHLSGSHGYQVG
jgi:hypothetical protein